MKLEVNSINKKFGSKVVLNNLSFVIQDNEVVGLVGPNGAGKTTLLNIIIGMVKATSGTLNYSEKHAISAAISRKGFFTDMTVDNNLLMYANVIGVDRLSVSTAKDEFFIDFGNKRFGELSAGMKQRVALACAFMKQYSLFLLDEPTNHLDIDSIISLRNLIAKARNGGASFLVTSHVFYDLERVCDRILFLKDGQIVRSTTVKDLLRDYGTLEEGYVAIFKSNVNAKA